MKIVYFGTPQFAVAPLRAAVESKHSVLAAVTQPDRAKDRRGDYLPSPVKSEAYRLNLPVLQFESIKQAHEELAALNADIFVTAGYGQLFSQKIIDIPKFGIINIHASLLPSYRGSSPIQWAIMNDEKITGVSIMQTDLGLDTGDVLLSAQCDILDSDNYDSLSNKLSNLGARLLVNALDLIEKGQIEPKKQDEALSSKYPLITKQMGKLDFSRSARELFNMIRAINCHTTIDGKYVKIIEARAIENTSRLECGQICGINEGLDVVCSSGALRIISLQPQNKRIMSAKEFLLGNKLSLGTKIGV